MAEPSKSDRTRAAILAAALELFSGNGYEATTIRDIAARAKIDPALVIRYFGSKDELFMRVAVFDLRLPDFSGVSPARVGEVLARHFFEVWEGTTKTDGMIALLRSAASNDYAARKVREIFSRQVAPALSALGLAPAPSAALVSTQLLGLAFCRYVLQIPPIVAMSPDEIVRHVAPTLQAYLAPARPARSPPRRRRRASSA